MIARTVAVVIAVPVAVAVGTAALGAVQDDGHVRELLFGVNVLQLAQHAALQQAGTDHKDGAVGILRQDVGIGHQLDGRTVYQDIVVTGTEVGKQCLQALARQQLRRIGRNGAHRQHVETDSFGGRHHDVVDALHLTGQVITQPVVGGTDIDRGGTAAQVTVDDQHPLSLEGQRGGDVDGQEGLAAAGIEGSQQDDLPRSRLGGHKLQVGPQHPEGLVHHVPPAFLHHDFGLGQRSNFFPEQAGTAHLAVKGNLAHKGQGEVLQVLPAPYPGIHAFLQEDDDHRKEQAQGKADQQDVLLHRSRGNHGAGGRGDDPGVVGGKGLRKLVFLPLLEEEEVERLLHLLLAFDRQQVFGLRRIGRDAGRRLLVALLQRADLGGQCRDQVVDRTDDAAPHGAEGLVHVDHQGVPLAAVGHQVVALELQAVVFRNLALDVGALQPRIGRQQLVAAGGGGEVVADVAGHGELGVQGQDLRLGLAALRHVELRGRLHVGQQVLAFESRNVFIHMSQFAFDHAQAVVDKQGSTDRNLVLVLDPVLVIHGNQGIQHLLRPLDAGIPEAQVDYGGLLVVQGHAQSRGVAGNRRIHRRSGYRQRLGRLLPGEAVLARADNHLAQGGHKGIIQRPHHGAVQRLAIAGKLRQLHALRTDGLHHERGGFVVGQPGKGDRQGQVPPVADPGVETALSGIVHVQVQALHHVVHDGRRAQRNQLVIDVGAGLEQAHVGKRGSHVARKRLSLGFLLDEEGGGTGIDRRGLQQVNHGNAQADGQGKDKPFPPGQAEVIQILDADKIVGLGSRTGRIIRCN